MLASGLHLLHVQATARPFADALQSIVRAQANDDAQEPRFVHAMMIEQWRIGAGHGRDNHVGYAHALKLPSRLDIMDRVFIALGALSGFLDMVVTRAFSVAKRVRTETDIGQSAVSVSYAAVELARSFCNHCTMTALVVRPLVIESRQMKWILAELNE